MKVKELIELLLQRDQEQEVVVPGYEDGYDIASSISNILIKRNGSDEWYRGKYSVVGDYCSKDMAIPAYIITSE